MKGAVDKFVDFAKTLPGFGLVFLIATLAYSYLKEEGKELSTSDTFVTAIVCWLLYHAASYLDKIYDKVYGPKSALRRLWKISALRAARDRAARALFEPVDRQATDYVTAQARGHIGDLPLPSLYSLCSAAAKPTEVWQRRIAPKIDVSKAARTIFAFAVVALLITEVTPLQELVGAGRYIQRLGLAAGVWFQAAMALLAFVVYVALRVQHHIELFEYVATRVTHVPVQDKKAAVIFDVVIPSTKGG